MCPDSQLFQSPQRRCTGGFTLVEILIVVVILGILASIVVPKLSNASQVSREGTLKDEVRFLRTQIAVYAAQHHDVCPGYPGGDSTQTPSQTTFVSQMTQYTDDAGNVSATQSVTHKFGPYLSRMPENPVNALSSIKFIDGSAAMTPDGSTGWLYQPATGAILPNLLGADSAGQAYSAY